ncbi:MAG: Gfo/Idh/MocA family oxidoreductase [Gemmatimonadetes bacterium]|nr:Gfo/Idh/MocA family oxidoreductase [Gemmatimonadota bacterium]MYD27024.1 Gfo/Idh/MocA family oxidoreductase [Gemmatimonadota bacterium]MYI98189.1 Gfo/Idh/MocA family oxidoreductase [Gemmatimonadota bacterium]
MKTYRVGIIGLGRMGSTIDDEGHTPLPYSVAAACRASERLEIAAGCDLRAERREDFSRRWGVNALYEDFREMVREERPDLVAVCTTASGLQKPAREAPDTSFRGDSHADLAVALAEMGVPMLYVEKAMASSMAAADDIHDAVLKNGTVFNTGVLRRFDNRYGVVRDAVLRGDVGEPRTAVHYAQSSLMHGHIHSIDTLSWLIGDPVIRSVRGEIDPRDYIIEGDHIPYDPIATYELDFENGVRAWSIPAAGWEYEIIGTEGTIRSLNNGAGASLRRAPLEGRDDRKGRSAWEEVPFEFVTPKSTVVSCLEDLVRAYETGDQSRGHVEIAHHITEACIAVAESHRRNGTWVDLPLANRDLYIWHV